MMVSGEPGASATGGASISTTLEHPFYVDGKGWTLPGELRIGDRIPGLDPRESVAVRAISATRRDAKVYNLRVADYHTYFVGDESWGFTLWAHNGCQKQHAGFKYILRGLNQWKNGTTSLVNLGQTTVKLGRGIHRQLHKAFDAAYNELRQNKGWRNIAGELSRGNTTPAELFAAMRKVTKQHLTGPKLEQALSELRRLRKLF